MNVSDLAPIAFSGYAHFTAMQVRQRRIRGLDLHLERLRSASEEMFGHTIAEEKVRDLLRSALAASDPDCSLLATIYSSAGEFSAGGGCESSLLNLLVRTTDPYDGPRGPINMATYKHDRFLPHIKHVGEVAKTWFLVKAVDGGYDDAVFLNKEGFLSEGTIWNLAFWDGDKVIWPKADVLLGTTMSIVSRQLKGLRVPQVTREMAEGDLSEGLSAVVMNSWTPAVAISKIGSSQMADASKLVALMHEAYDAEPQVLP